MKNSLKITSVLTIIIMTLPIIAMAGGPGFGGGVDDGGANCQVPLDGGLSMLIAAGVGYGAKKLAIKRNKANGIDEQE
jgi:hypothetical protein